MGTQLNAGRGRGGIGDVVTLYQAVLAYPALGGNSGLGE